MLGLPPYLRRVRTPPTVMPHLERVQPPAMVGFSALFRAQPALPQERQVVGVGRKALLRRTSLVFAPTTAQWQGRVVAHQMLMDSIRAFANAIMTTTGLASALIPCNQRAALVVHPVDGVRIVAAL